jgi:Peptidase family C25
VSGAAWLDGFQLTSGGLRFRVEAGHRYLAVSQSGLLSPRVAQMQPSQLTSVGNRADYLLIAPRAFLAAAEPLMERRRDQGLAARAVAFEEIADEFGHGQPSAEAIRAFIAYAYQSWAQPSPRYVLLLGDSSYDPRNFTGTSQPSPLPALWTKTSYLWTASDPLLAAVNGDDDLPDLAIGRLPATTLEQAQLLVEKLLTWEDSGQGLSGAATLVADNPDLAGDFEANAEEIAASYLAGRSEVLRLRELGGETRGRIEAALDGGLSYLDYVGHGGSAVWASENVWNSWDAASLLAQSRQPLLVTMNCLNGYFVAPTFESLSESLVKAEGRGAIAAFSPSGLSLDGPAHVYHRALMAELVSGRHERLGDAVLAAQQVYAQSGLMPELVSVYHLLGDPAMRIR